MVEKVAIAGLGLIGGSLARRLAARGVEVTAWNRRPHPYAQAEAEGIHCVSTLEELVDAEPEVLVLCNPLKAMPDILRCFKPLLDAHPEVTLTDVGSVKSQVRAQVIEAGLGERYVGAHPMAGNELSGWQAADPALYDDALWALTVDEHTEYRRFLAVARLVADDVGNRLIVLDDDTHDRCAAMISHMPHVVATALVNELVSDQNRNIAAVLAAGSWRDMTRVALTDPDRTRAMVDEDAANVEQLLRRMATRLTAVADNLRGGDDGAITSFFAEGQPFRDYKANGNGYKERNLSIQTQNWQQTLLQSARRGEAITAFLADREVCVRSMGDLSKDFSAR